MPEELPRDHRRRVRLQHAPYSVATKDTRDIMPLIEEIFKHYADVKDGDFLRETIALILNKLMEAQVSAQIGSEKYERSEAVK